MDSLDQSNLLDITADLIARARAKGADAADAMMAQGLSLEANVRLGNLEDVERSEGSDLGLRVFVGRSQASVSTTDFSANSLDETADRAIAMARIAPEDEFAGLASADQITSAFAELDLFDTATPSAEELEATAIEAEEAALAVKGVTNSIGASAAFGVTGICLATSNGFSGAYQRSGFSLSCSALAGEGTGMERDYDYSSKVHMSELDGAQQIGRIAGERAIARLAPRKMPSQSAPVVFDPRVSSNLLSNFTGAISGAAIARGTSFLKDAMCKQIFAKNISIIDDPLILRGLRSKPFDGEGIAPERLALIENGHLTTWLLDCRTARQLGLQPNGRAARGTGGAPSPGSTNLYMAAGTKTPGELIGDIQSGLYVTQLMGHGGSVVTGDYSTGVAGFWIENGEIAFPVSEMTIASTLPTMFASLEPANDLEFKAGINAPTLRIEEMTIAGT
jgi:PmbA protein